MKILIKFPTRGRKEKFFNVLDKYYELLEDLDKTEFQITIDDDDTIMNNQEVLSKLSEYKNLKVNLGKSDSKIHAINRDIVVSDWDIILIASDDMIPKVKGYDTIIRSKMQELYPDTDGILWFHDGNRKDLNTLSILGREYYKRFNYVYYPEYKSFWCDNEFTQIGNILKKQTFIDQVIIHHEHPDWGFGGSDGLYVTNSKFNGHDMNLFMLRSNKNFDL
jgi:hypothetical protein